MSNLSSKLKKSPFKGFSVEEVLASEGCGFVIQAGNDFYHNEGKMVFSKRSAAIFYNKILNEIVNTINCGNTKQRENAHNVLRNLRILPLRIQ